MRVVLDTNVVVSGMFWTGPSFKVLDLVIRKKIIAVASPEIVREYSDVLARDEIINKTGELQQAQLETLHKLLAYIEIVEPKDTKRIVPHDADDDKFMHCAKEGQCDIVITQDKHLLSLGTYENVRIVTPEKMLEMVSDFKE